MSLALLLGDRHQGKTTTCRQLVERLRARGLSVAGIIAPAVFESGRCVGYAVVDLATGRSARLATLHGPGVNQVGCYHFLAEGLALGRTALQQAAERPHHQCGTGESSVVIVDEVGPLELAGGGWSEQLDRLAPRKELTLLTVRRSLATQVAERWAASPGALYDLADGAIGVIDAILKSVGTLDNLASGSDTPIS